MRQKHPVLAGEDFAQVTRTQQLPTKTHASAELPGEKNYRLDPTWTSLPKAGAGALALPRIAGGAMFY